MSFLHLARPSSAPNLVHSYGRYVGIVAAVVMLAFATLHLFRIDTFIPLVQDVLPFRDAISSLLAAGLLIAEVFAVPFLLRMNLSVLARILSGFFVAIAPLSWLLMSIWNIGTGVPSAAFGQFVVVNDGLLTVFANAVWLGLNCLALWMLGYGNIKLPMLRR